MGREGRPGGNGRDLSQNSLKPPENPKVSVIIPCYNGERFIGEAIESVLNQTYQNFEIIIVDGGLTDASKSVIKPFLKDPRIKLVQHEQNRGIPAARNTGIRTSKGEYIAFLDHDDVWLREKLERQIAVFERGSSDLGLVFSKINVVNSEGVVKERLTACHVPSHINELPPREVLGALFLYNFIPSVTALVRKECINTLGLLDETIRGGADDYELWLRLAAKYKIEYLDIPLAVHRLHAANYSNAERLFKDNLLIMDRTLAQVPSLAPLEIRSLRSYIKVLEGIINYRDTFIVQERLFGKPYDTVRYTSSPFLPFCSPSWAIGETGCFKRIELYGVERRGNGDEVHVSH